MIGVPVKSYLLHDYHLKNANLEIKKLKLITPTHCHYSEIHSEQALHLHKLRVWYQRGIALLIAVQIVFHEFPQMR